MELIESHPDVDDKDKGQQLRWTYGMDECMIDTFLEQARLGHKGPKGFDEEAYNAVIKALAERLDTDVCKKHIDHRLKSFRTEYRMFSTLREQNGFSWDSAKNKVTAQDSTWNDYIKAHPKFKSFRGRACKWNYESLGIILGKDLAMECSSTDNPDSSDSQPDLESNEKGRQVRWSQEMDKCMISTFIEQAKLGLKREKGFKDKAYTAVSKALDDELGVEVCKNHIDNRLRTFRTEYNVFRTLREHNEFSWDSSRNKVIASDSIWNEYLKDHPEFKPYRGRQCKWDYDSLGIIVGNKYVTLTSLDSNESTPEIDDKGRGKQLRWTREMDECMIETIINLSRITNKGNRGFKDQVYDAVRKALADQVEVDVCRKHIDNRLKSFRTEYHMFRTLREQKGFEWDSSENTVIASDSTWSEFIVMNPKFKHYRGRACKWDYESLGVIVGNEKAQSPGNELALMVDDHDSETDNVEEEEEEFTKRTLPTCTPKSRAKKARIAEVVREVMEMVNEKMKMKVDGLTFAKELYREVMKMKVEGFNPDFLDRAFEILKRDGHGAEIFLVRSEIYRKRMLKEMEEKYGESGFAV